MLGIRNGASQGLAILLDLIIDKIDEDAKRCERSQQVAENLELERVDECFVGDGTGCAYCNDQHTKQPDGHDDDPAEPNVCETTLQNFARREEREITLGFHRTLPDMHDECLTRPVHWWPLFEPGRHVRAVGEENGA